MNINLKRRYPNSRTEDITDAFSRGYEAGMNHNEATEKSYSQGYEDGYEAGYDAAKEYWHEECRQLRECLSALLDK